MSTLTNKKIIETEKRDFQESLKAANSSLQHMNASWEFVMFVKYNVSLFSPKIQMDLTVHLILIMQFEICFYHLEFNRKNYNSV